MSGPGPAAPQGVNTAMLTSMKEHDHPYVGSGAAVGGGGPMGQIGGELGQGLKAGIPLGEVANMDELGKILGEGVFNENFIEKAFSGNVGPFNINYADWHKVQLMGNIDLSTATSIMSNLNAPQTVPGLVYQGGGQQH